MSILMRPSMCASYLSKMFSSPLSVESVKASESLGSSSSVESSLSVAAKPVVMASASKGAGNMRFVPVYFIAARREEGERVGGERVMAKGVSKGIHMPAGGED